MRRLTGILHLKGVRRLFALHLPVQYCSKPQLHVDAGNKVGESVVHVIIDTMLGDGVLGIEKEGHGYIPPVI